MLGPEIALFIQMAFHSANLLKLGGEFLEKFKRAPSQEEAAELKAQAAKEAAAAVANLPDDVKLSSMTIQVLKGRAQKTMNSIEECYNEPDMFIAEMRRMAGGLTYEYCFFINEMKKYNRGELPNFMISVWDDTCCNNDGTPRYKTL
jgi:hypothetical protein